MEIGNTITDDISIKINEDTSNRPKLSAPPKLADNKINRTNILNQLARRQDIKSIVNYIVGYDKYYKDELYQELFLTISELEEDKLIGMYQGNWIDYYLIRTLNNMFDSTTSRFYYKIKKHIQLKEDHINQETGEDKLDNIPEYSKDHVEGKSTDFKHRMLDELEEHIKSLYWYDKGIINLYLEHGTMKKVSELTGINIEYISQSIKRSKDTLRKSIPNAINRLEENEMY